MTSFLQNKELTIALSGEIDHHSAKEYMSTIKSKLEIYDPVVCILDFKDVTFMDSSGIALILRIHRMMLLCGGKARVENAENQPLRVIDASGINRIVGISMSKEI